MESLDYLPGVTDLDYQYMTPIDITTDGIAHLINNLKLSTSAGIDSINSKVIKNSFSFKQDSISCFPSSLTTG